MNLKQNSNIIPSSKIEILVVVIKINSNSWQYYTPSSLLLTHSMNSVDLACDVGVREIEILFKLAKRFNTQMEIDMFYNVYEKIHNHNFPK